MADNTPPVHNEAVMEEAHKPYTQPFVELYEINLSAVGSPDILYFTSSYKENQEPIKFNKKNYIALPIKAEGFEQNGDGSLSTPTLTLGAVNRVTAAMIINNRNLVGCEFTRIRTFEHFLDDGEQPNPSAYFRKDIYTINRKKNLNNYQASFELINIVNYENKQLPRNQVIKYYCPYIYRIFSQGEFIYDDCYPCPYVGDKYFDENNNPCEKSKDKCNKQLSGCEARYGNSILPYQGFPAVPKR